MPQPPSATAARLLSRRDRRGASPSWSPPALRARSQRAQTSKRVVKEADNPTLGKTVLTANKGLTLYSLSAEKNGRFICTGSCSQGLAPAGRRRRASSRPAR